MNPKFKHLRGKHDQLDHAWNRGMGRGGGAGEIGPNQMGPIPTMDWYQKRRTEFAEMVRNGEMTRTEMRNQLRQLSGAVSEPSRREQASAELASKRNSPINQTQPPQLDNPIPTDTVSPTDSTPLQQVVGEIANKIASRILGFIDTLGRRSEAVSDQVQSASSSLLQRINDLMQRPKRRNDQQVTPIETNTPTEPTLPEGYDTTLFDTPNLKEFAPRPIKMEMLEPGGEVYKQLEDIWKSGKISRQDDQNNDFFLVQLRNNAGMNTDISNPTRWQIALINQAMQIRMDLEKYGLTLSPLPSESSDLWNNYLERKANPVNGGVTDENEYVAAMGRGANDYLTRLNEQRNTLIDKNNAATASISDSMSPEEIREINSEIEFTNEDIRTIDERIEQQEESKKRNNIEVKRMINTFNAGVDTDYDQLSALAEQTRAWLLEAKTQIDSSPEKDNIINGVNFYNKGFLEINGIKDTILSKFDDSGKVKPFSVSDMIQGSPQTAQAALYSAIGYDALPQAVNWNELSQDSNAFSLADDTDFSTPEESKDPLIMYRSIRGTTDTGFGSVTSSVVELNGDDIYNLTLNSDRAHVGLGVDGFGMYTKSKGRNEPNNDEANGSQMLIGREKYGNLTFAMTMNKDARVYTNPEGLLSIDQQVKDRFFERYPFLRGVSVNPGVMMTMLGYDAYIARTDYQGGYNWVILNRAATKMSNLYIGPDADPSLLDYASRTGKLP